MTSGHGASTKAAAVSIIFTMLLLIAQPATAEIATPQEAELVCTNWLTNTVDAMGDWNGTLSPEIRSVRELTDGDQLLAYCYDIAPQGYVLVPILKELPPIKAWSADADLDLDNENGTAQLLRDVLKHRLNLYTKFYGSLDASQSVRGEVMLDPVHKEQWNRFLVDPDEFAASLADKSRDSRAIVGPLLTTVWDQGDPYNQYCPIGSSGRCVVGCVATAFSQIMNYHQWPPAGEGDYIYTWWGDYSCEGSDPTPGADLYADFSDPYDWENIPQACHFGCEPEEEAAVAELCYEVGVALEMGYGSCGSGAWPGMMITMLPAYFMYRSDGLTEIIRSDYTAEQWYAIIMEQIDLGLPAEYTIYSHSIVCDGYNNDGGLMQYHFNYGWGGPSTSWYTIDELHCPWEGCDPMIEDMMINIKPDKSVVMAVDTTMGWVPFEVGFTGFSELVVDEWTWFFGDGQQSHDQSPSHIYEQAGIFDVSLQVNSGGGVYSRTRPEYVVALADSLIGPNKAGLPGETVEIVVYARNTLPVNQIKVPMMYGTGDLDLTYLSFSTEDCRTDYFDVQSQIQFVPSTKKTTFKLQASTSGALPDLEPGYGPILKVSFEVSSGAVEGQSTPVELGTNPNYDPLFYTDRGDYEARTLPIVISYGEGGCCVGMRGNVDNDPAQIIDISDLIYLVDYMFQYGPAPECPEEADINGEGGLDISDLVDLVGYMFEQGMPPAQCPL